MCINQINNEETTVHGGKTKQGKFNGRVGKILSVDQENDIAMAKAEILTKRGEIRYIDIFLLKKIEGEWKIISKAATKK